MPAINPLNYYEYKKKLNTFFQTHKEYKIIHSHLNALSFIILGVAKKQGVPIRIAHSHTAIEPFSFPKIFNKNTDIVATIKDTIQSTMRFKVQETATHFFACGTKAGIWLFGKNNIQKVTIINNAINASNFVYDKNRSVFIKNTLGLNNKKIIGHVGNFSEPKNHFFLIKIFKKLIQENNDIALVLVGEGNLMTVIEKYVKELHIETQVHFLGVRADIPDLLQAFDLFLFPSLYEGLPVTLIEAQAAGLKIIASNTVSSEVAITDLITFCNLESSETIWVEQILNNLNYKRKNTKQQIIDSEYDIQNNAMKLQEFYLKKAELCVE